MPTERKGKMTGLINLYPFTLETVFHLGIHRIVILHLSALGNDSKMVMICGPKEEHRGCGHT